MAGFNSISFRVIHLEQQFKSMKEAKKVLGSLEDVLKDNLEVLKVKGDEVRRKAIAMAGSISGKAKKEYLDELKGTPKFDGALKATVQLRKAMKEHTLVAWEKAIKEYGSVHDATFNEKVTPRYVSFASKDKPEDLVKLHAKTVKAIQAEAKRIADTTSRVLTRCEAEASAAVKGFMATYDRYKKDAGDDAKLVATLERKRDALRLKALSVGGAALGAIKTWKDTDDRKVSCVAAVAPYAKTIKSQQLAFAALRKSWAEVEDPTKHVAKAKAWDQVSGEMAKAYTAILDEAKKADASQAKGKGKAKQTT